MVAIPRPPRPADLSPERRETVLGLLGDERFRTADLSFNSRILYTLSALVCDETGLVRQVDMEHALDDPSLIQCARSLLKRAGY